MSIRISLGLEVKLARVRRGLHLYEVARALGITPARLSQYEGGHQGLRQEGAKLLHPAPPERRS